MLTPARAAISRVPAPSKPRSAKMSSAAPRIRALVEPGASRASSSGDLATGIGQVIRALDWGGQANGRLRPAVVPGGGARYLGKRLEDRRMRMTWMVLGLVL